MFRSAIHETLSAGVPLTLSREQVTPLPDAVSVMYHETGLVAMEVAR